MNDTNNIDWFNVHNFSKNEFPEDPDKYVDPRLIYTLDKYRTQLGHKVFPSPVKGALARLGGSRNSRHYAIGRKSDAIDIFPDCNVMQAFFLALSMEDINGIGIYPYTCYNSSKLWPMLHIDMRPLKNGKKTIWMRNEAGNYIYPNNNDEYSENFIRELQRLV